MISTLPNANTLSPRLKFGTSSWTYPGWKGLVYFDQYASDKAFRQSSLLEYARQPLFRTVGVDNSFYRPLSPANLARYAGQVPKEFQWVSKVWEKLTIHTFPVHPRYGQSSGRENPDFLNTRLFSREVLAPLQNPEILPHVGPLVFQFPWFSPKTLTLEKFLAYLSNFLGQLPTEFRYAIEIRNQEFLTTTYFEVLNRFGSTHCFNHWSQMPPLHQQMRRAADAGGLSAQFYVARVLTPLGVSYEDAVRLFQPYSMIQRPNEQMRNDIVRLCRRALERDVDAYILVNNRSEGCAPLTIAALVRTLTT